MRGRKRSITRLWHAVTLPLQVLQALESLHQVARCWALRPVLVHALQHQGGYLLGALLRDR